MPLVFDFGEQAIRTITLGPNQNIAPIKQLQGNWPRSALTVGVAVRLRRIPLGWCYHRRTSLNASNRTLGQRLAG